MAHEYRLIIRFKADGPDTTFSTQDASSFVRVLNTALAVAGYIPVHLWVIECKNRAVASQEAGSPLFIDHDRLSAMGAVN